MLNPPDIERCSDIYIDDYVLVSRQVYYNPKEMKRVRAILPYIKVLKKIARVKSNPVIRFSYIRGLNEGFCTQESEIEICLKKVKTKKDLVTVLAHELIHCQQFQSGRLIYSKGKEYWLGKEYKMPNQTYASYLECPWEKEAYGLQSKYAREAYENVLHSVTK